MKRGMEPFLVLNSTISSKSVLSSVILQVLAIGQCIGDRVILFTSKRHWRVFLLPPVSCVLDAELVFIVSIWQLLHRRDLSGMSGVYSVAKPGQRDVNEWQDLSEVSPLLTHEWLAFPLSGVGYAWPLPTAPFSLGRDTHTHTSSRHTFMLCALCSFDEGFLNLPVD